MKLRQNASLTSLNTLGIEANTGQLLTIETEEDLLSAPSFNTDRDIVLGGGSNVVFITDVPGTVYLNRIKGRNIVEDHDGQVVIEAGAGENWHELVQWTLNQGLSGIENLSLIPGLAGAAPVQNIGAYGVELSSVLESVTAWDFSTGDLITIDCADCHLAYRDSLFKSVEPSRFLITSIRLRLNRRFTPQTDYSGLREELLAIGIQRPEARHVSDAVIRLRRRKLPDPAQVGNVGSFFKNPIIDIATAEQLQTRYSALPVWPVSSTSVKLSAAWMIEYCNLKGSSHGDAGISDQHALVIVNHGSATGAQIAELSMRVQSTVNEQFGIHLEPEPRLVTFE